MDGTVLTIIAVILATAGAILALWSIKVARESAAVEEAYDDWYGSDTLTPTPRAHLHRNSLRPQYSRPWNGKSLGRKHHIRPRS